MPKTAQKTQARQAAAQFLENNTALIAKLVPDTPDAAVFIHNLTTIHPGLDTLDKVCAFAFESPKSSAHLTKACQALKVSVRMAKSQARSLTGAASHREKRNLIHRFGLNTPPRSIGEIQATQSRLDVGTLTNPRIVWRKRQAPPIGRYTVLSDTKCRSEPDFVIDDTDDFVDVDIGDSVIFVDHNAAGEVGVELVVLRGVLSGAPFSDDLFPWLEKVIVAACWERRNVRPTHDGTLVQVGWNAGPRHARVFGLAKSYTKHLPAETAVDHDEDAIAAMTLTWSACKAFLPTEVTSEIEKHLETAGLPRMATRQVPPGEGYRFNIAGHEFAFPTFERAPSEGMFSQDYSAWSHTDPAYAKWGLSFNVAHKVDPLPAVTVLPEPNGTSGRRTRSSQQPIVADMQEDMSKWLIDGGGNFVDVSLRVRVKQAAATLMAFRPEYMHGTTRLCGAHSMGCTIPFCTRLLVAFNKAKEQTSVESFAGAGEDSQ
ncbi:hypothetical protein DFH06DRAFT_1198319 [Mycena polygramma]|nr:hypothetical protein DFH06DRAFT_1198319 [Mycena polygramma]